MPIVAGCSDGSTRGYPNQHFAVDRGGIEVDQPIASEVTPIVWPRPEGDLPEPPSTPLYLPQSVVANKGALSEYRHVWEAQFGNLKPIT